MFCDPRSDSDALYHHYGILLKNVFCVQLAEVKVRRSAGHKVRFVRGGKKIIDEYGELSEEELNEWNGLNQERSKGGSYIDFRRRPMSSLALKHTALGVLYLLRIYEKLKRKLRCSDKTWVEEESEKRVEECLKPTYHECEQRAVAPGDWFVCRFHDPERGISKTFKLVIPRITHFGRSRVSRR